MSPAGVVGWLARYVAMHKDLKMPFRRSEIGRVYRDGPIKLGRYREFIQCDFDTIGSESLLSDVETALVIHELMLRLGVGAFTIRLNNR